MGCVFSDRSVNSVINAHKIDADLCFCKKHTPEKLTGVLYAEICTETALDNAFSFYETQLRMALKYQLRGFAVASRTLQISKTLN